MGRTASILAIITSAILFKIGFATLIFSPGLGSFDATVAIIFTYLTGFALIIGGISSVDVSKHHRELSGLAFIAIVLTAYSAFLTKTGAEYLGTDGILFARYSVDMLLQGHNPYALSMEPAYQNFAIDRQFVTYKVDGSIVHSLSYPALSVLAFVPQAALGVPNLNLTAVVVFLAVLAFLLWETPPEFALAPMIVMFADPNLIFFTYGGVFDILWVFPLLVAMWFWSRRQYTAAAFVVGLAFAVKQTPWFIAPFAAVWLYMEAETIREYGAAAGKAFGAGLGGFLLPNAPFLIWNFQAWQNSVLTPISSGVDLVQQGNGLVVVSVVSTYTLPKSAFTILVILALIVLLSAYTLYFDRVKWMMWVAPAIILWFNYRSLTNYFVFFVPVAYYAALCAIRAGDFDV